MKKITTERSILTENSDTLKDYFHDISKYPIYSGEEQIELARLMKSGDEIARQKLITSNLRFVITCAKKYVNQGVPLLDLIQAGTEGLILATNSYDPDMGYKFLSYAVWYIRREILKAIYNTGKTIRYPITYITRITKVKRVYDNFVLKNNREPTEEELIELTDLNHKQLNDVNLNKNSCISFDTPVINGEKLTVLDTIADESSDVYNNFSNEIINNCLKILSEREYKVIVEYYGLNGEAEKSIKEIAKELNIGDERIRQLRKNAVKKLYNRFGNLLKPLLENV